jgi:hypothetical protein
MKSPNYRSCPKEQIWRQERAILKAVSPKYQQDLIQLYHLKKFRPSEWRNLAPAVQGAARTLWWKVFLPSPAGMAYLMNGFSEPSHRRDPILDQVDGSPSDQINGYEWQYPAVAFRKPVTQRELALIGDQRLTSDAPSTKARFEFQKQLGLVDDSEWELF